MHKKSKSKQNPSDLSTAARPADLPEDHLPLLPLQDYLIKTNKAHSFTYRPGEYYPQSQDTDLKVALCSITEIGTLQFSFGADIIDRELRKDPKTFVDRACLWPTSMLDVFKIQKTIYHGVNVRDCDLIMISAFMAHQVLNIVPFLLQCRISPLKANREQVVILGGNCSLMYRFLAPFIDLFYFGDGERFVRDMVNIRRANRDKASFLSAISESDMRDCVTEGEVKTIIPAVQKDLAPSILTRSDFISKPINNVLETQRGCKYDCYFCFLTAYKCPYRLNKIENLIDAVKTYNPGDIIYPFAPDEASYPWKVDLYKAVNEHGCRMYSYNKRFDTFDPETDFKAVEATSRVVFGLDGLSERSRRFCNKNITLDQIYRGVTSAIKETKVSKLKINLVFAYENERDADYNEFRDLLNEFCLLRMKIRPEFNRDGQEVFAQIRTGQKLDDPLIFHLAPTPHVPMPGTPFELMPSVFTYQHGKRFTKIVHDLAVQYSFCLIEGLNGEDAHNVQTMLWRGGAELTPTIIKWHKATGSKSFSSQDCKLFLRFCRNDGIKPEGYLQPLERSTYPEVKFKHSEAKRRELYAARLDEYSK